MIVGSTVVLCLHAWLLADEELLVPTVAGAAPAGAQDDVCDVVAVECARGSAVGVILSLSTGPADSVTQLVLPVPPTTVPCTDAASASDALRDAYALELGSTSRCVLSEDGAEGLTVQIEVARPAGVADLLKFAVACSVTCTPYCVVVGLALALAAHPQAHALAVMVEEKTRQSGLLPRCDFDIRTLGAPAGEHSPFGKLV